MTEPRLYSKCGYEPHTGLYTKSQAHSLRLFVGYVQTDSWKDISELNAANLVYELSPSR